MQQDLRIKKNIVLSLLLPQYKFNDRAQRAREVMYSDVTKFINPTTFNQNMCFNTNGELKMGNLLLKKRGKLGEGSVNAEAHAVTLQLPNRKPIWLSGKIIPIRHVQHWKLLQSKDESHQRKAGEVGGELLIYRLCNDLVRSRICPNLPLFYLSGLCKTCTYENSNINKLRMDEREKCVIVLNELQRGDLRDWTSMKRTLNEWKSMYFQVFAGLLALQGYFGIVHNDLHWGNVLFRSIKLDPKLDYYYIYIVNNKPYAIPLFGEVFMLFDFGYSSLPKFIRGYVTDRMKESVRDYSRISAVPYWCREEKKALPPKPIFTLCDAVYKMSKQGKPLISVVEALFADYSILPNPKDNPIILGVFDLDAPVNPSRGLAPYYLTKGTFTPRHRLR